MNKAFTPIGLTIVLTSVIGGYVLEHGNLHVLWQPVELLIIGETLILSKCAGRDPLNE